MARDWIRSFGWEVTRYRRDGGTGRFFENLVRKRFDPRLIVDVGANRGAWTRLAARYFPLAEFVLVEPQESMRVYLEALCHDIPRVRWMNVAAGETTTQTSMNVCMDPTHSSLLDKPQLISPGDEVVMRQEIEVLPLASMCNDIPSFVKIDTVGFEMPVLSVLLVGLTSSTLTVFQFALSGANRHRAAGVSELGNGILCLFLGALTVRFYGHEWVAVGIFGAAALTSVWILPRQIRKHFELTTMEYRQTFSH
jgi:FkbM family methyltransferase